MKNLFTKKTLTPEETLKSNKKALFVVGAAATLLLPTEIFAATGLPAIVAAYSEIVTNIITKVIVGLVVLVMMVIAAWEMKENGNARPLKWAIFASIIMGGAVFFGPSILDYMNETVSGYTGTASVS